MKSRLCAAALFAAVSMVAPAAAQVVVGKGATANMSCSGGVCVATAAQAILNARDLKVLLRKQDVTVDAGPAGAIWVTAPVSWTKKKTLTLSAPGQQILFSNVLKATGGGSLTMDLGADQSGPELGFSGKGQITFLDAKKSKLKINSVPYKLEGDLASLAAAIAANTDGNFALANDYDASADGAYIHPPVGSLIGVFEGLGHTISNLRIDDSTNEAYVGLFSHLQSIARDVSLVSLNLTASGDTTCVGGFVAFGQARILNVFVSGQVAAPGAIATGGVVGCGNSILTQVMAAVSVTGNTAGGLVGEMSGGSISNVLATGAVTAADGINDPPAGGGLVGQVDTGSVFATYTTGAVGGIGALGGLIGTQNQGGFTEVYWDTTTSGRSNAVGDGNVAEGATGLTTSQLQAGLPSGFDPTIWGRSAKVNNGMPYLLAVPPR